MGNRNYKAPNGLQSVFNKIQASTARLRQTGARNITIKGRLTPENAMRLGRQWVGRNPTMKYNERTHVLTFRSADKNRSFRSPSLKSGFRSETRMQANFELKGGRPGRTATNVHIDIEW